jgi:catechol 2,3-dioxygenase
MSVSIHPDTTVGAVRLVVSDVPTAREFYERAIGLRTVGRENGPVRLGVDGEPLVELVAEPDAAPRPPGTSGLFHLAILVPDRRELARAMRRVIEAGGRFSGASDHLVSEALYLHDPEGNGIEIYRDRPREEWERSDGEIRMATLPLDLAGIAAELRGDDDTSGAMAPGTRVGHVHLNVSDIGAAEEFYAGTLGLDVTVRSYPGALFLSVGGYHHHVAVNTWAGEGAPPPPPGARGLRWFELALPAAGPEGKRVDGGVVVTDPSGNAILLRSPR